MTSRRWINGILVAVAAVLMVFWLPRQRAELKDLRSRVQDLRTPANVVPATAPARPENSSSLSNDEMQEMLRLRAEVTRLHGQQKLLSQAVETNQRLKSEAARRSTNAVPSKLRLPPNYMRRSTAQMRGLDTPQQALESFLWAIEHRDTNTLFAIIHPDGVDQFAKMFTSAGTEAAFKELAVVPGFAVRQESKTDEDNVTLSVEAAPETPPTPMKFRRVAGQWRLHW